MIDVEELLSVILYISLTILVIVSIVAVFKLIKTLDKVNLIVDNVDTKVKKLNGVFDLIDNTADVINTFSDKIASGISNAISYLVNRKKKGDNDE